MLRWRLLRGHQRGGKRRANFNDIVPSGEKCVDACRIKFFAFLLLEVFSGLLNGHGILIRAFGRKCVEHIRDHDDPCRDRNVVSLQAVWISTAVPSLVMSFGNDRCELNEFAVTVGEDMSTDRRVCSDDLNLVGIQPARLQQNVVGNGNLADVVEGEARYMSRHNRSDRPSCSAIMRLYFATRSV